MVNEDKVFENKIRRMVYNFITTYPGVSFNNIKKIFELTDSNLRYHLNYLEKNNVVRSGTKSGMKCFYPASSTALVPAPRTAIGGSLILTADQQRLIDIIKQHPGINQKELVFQAGMDRGKVIRNLGLLENSNLISNTRSQNQVFYEYIPDVELKFLMLKGLIIRFLNNDIDETTFLRLKEQLD